MPVVVVLVPVEVEPVNQVLEKVQGKTAHKTSLQIILGRVKMETKRTKKKNARFT